MAVGCAGAALVAAGCGLTNAAKTTTITTSRAVTVTRTVTHTVTASAAAAPGNPCSAHDLTGTFQLLQGSAGAGNVVYTLKVTNASQAACGVSGVPTIQFMTSGGAALSQHASTTTDHQVLVTLQPGDSATSQVRFSPDVDPCDPGTAAKLQVEMPDHSTFDVAVDPPTRLCGAGSVQPSAFTGAD